MSPTPGTTRIQLSRSVSLAACAAVLASSASSGPAHDPEELFPFVGPTGTHHHEPRGARGPGATSLVKVGDEYRFQYGGLDETIRYVIDMQAASVQAGRIRVKETALSGGAVPILNGGLTWRTSAGVVESPADFSLHATTTLIHESMDAADRKLVLRYRDVDMNTGVVSVKTYQFQLKGKVLKIRLSADRAVNPGYFRNYAGVRMGHSADTFNAVQQHVPYMDSVPVILFDALDPLPDARLYFSCFHDWYKSNGADIDVWHDPAPASGTFEYFYGANYSRDETSSILAPIGETVNLIVTRSIDQIFPVISNPKSPYYDLLAARIGFNNATSGSGSWVLAAKKHFEALSDWGVDDLAGNMFVWAKYGTSLMNPDWDQAGLMGCDPIDVRPMGIPDVVIGGQTIEWVDPNSPANVATVKNRFGAMMDAARIRGHLVSLYQESGSLDPEGFPPYVSGTPCGASGWPVQNPLWIPGWNSTTLGKVRGLLVPSPNLGYPLVEYRVTRDWLDQPQTGWDPTIVFNGANTSWACAYSPTGNGHALQAVSPTYLLEHWTQEMSVVNASYRPGALFIDARTGVPSWNQIDHDSTSPRAKTMAKALSDERGALLMHRWNIGVPLHGENHHFRHKQFDSFAAGLWDGRHRKFPIDISELYSSDGTPPSAGKRNANSWVIPDYEQQIVNALCSGNLGMGAEDQHMNVSALPCDNYELPIDCRDGKEHGFLDSWWTNIVTFGHSGFFSSRGHHSKPSRTMEGILREYYLLSGLQRAYRNDTIPSVTYDHGGVPVDLDGALALHLDLRHPRITLTYPGGLVIHANHDPVASTATWDVVVQDTPPGGSPTAHTMQIPANGFVASDGLGLFVFSALNPYSATRHRIDYARVPGKWEMICTRGDPTQSFGSFPGSLHLFLPTFGYPWSWKEATIVRNDVHNFVLGARGGRWNQDTNQWESPSTDGQVEVVALGAAPTLSALQLKATDNALTVPVFRAVGISATAIYGATPSGAPIRRDVTPLVSWTVTSTPPAIAAIDQSGGLTLTAPGSVKIQASFGGVASALLQLTAVAGAPIAKAGPDLVIAAGGLAALDGSGSSDPEGGQLAAWWNFGDASPKAAGLRARHSYHAPGNYTVVFAVKDPEGNEASDTAAVSVPGATLPSGFPLRWADSFGDDALDGWTWKPSGSGWGIHSSAARQSLPSVGEYALGVAGVGWQVLSVVTDIQFLPPLVGASASAGIHVRKSNELDPPSASGYYCSLSSNGGVVLTEAGVASALVPIAGFNPAIPHKMHVEVVHLANGNERVHIYIDNALILSSLDPSPPTGSAIGLATTGVQLASFDNFAIYAP